MEDLEADGICKSSVLNELGDTTDPNSKDNYNICLLCSKLSNNSSNFNTQDCIDLKRVFSNLKIDINDVLKGGKVVVLFLCDDCRLVTGKLSSLFEELEVTKMWINDVLRNVMTVIISGEDNDLTDGCTEEVNDNYENVVQLRELIMEKCISTVNKTASPQLKLNRCHLPENGPAPSPDQQFSDDDDESEEEAYLSSADELPESLPPPPLKNLIKLEEIGESTFINEDSPLPLQHPIEGFSSLKNQKEKIVKKVKKHKPFWFIKPTEEITPDGTRQTKYNCPFCPKIVNGFSACKFHIIGNHPEQIFSGQQLTTLTPEEFSSCCSLILEEEVTSISNEDGKGSYTTFDCKYCSSSEVNGRKADKRVVQVHLIRCHYNELVSRLKMFQELHGSPEFEEKLAKYLEKPLGSFQKKVLGKCGEFKRKWRCDECQCGFPNKKLLDIHIQMHGEKRKINLEGKRAELTGASSTLPMASPCQTCGKVFSCGYSLWRHKRLSCSRKGSLSVNQVSFEPEVHFEEDEAGQEVDQNNLTVMPSSSAQLKLRCQLSKNSPSPDQQYSEDKDDQLSSSLSSPQPPPHLVEKIVKLEEIDITVVEQCDTMPLSRPPAPPSLQFYQTPPSLPVFQTPSSSLPIYQITNTSKSSESSSNKSNPFWFIKPTRQEGRKRAKYFCQFCPKSFNGSDSIKYHSINHHPDQIFGLERNMFDLTPEKYKACCFTILEEEVTPISNEDGIGSYTTFLCKYCPPTSKSASHVDKRFIKLHLIRNHFEWLVSALENLQLLQLQGSKEFEDRVAKYTDKPGSDGRKVWSDQFKRKWKCEPCGRGFPNFNRLDRHIKTCEKLNGGSVKVVSGYKKHESGDSTPRPSPCDVCGKVLSSGYSLWRHKRLRCLNGLRKKFEKKNDLVGQQVGIVNLVDLEVAEVEEEEEILPDVYDVDPLM